MSSDNNMQNLLDFGFNEMKQFFASISEPSYRALQIFKWIHQEYVDDFDLMTNISKSLRIKLKSMCVIKAPKIVSENISQDGTIKWLMMAGDSKIETVFIPEDKRSTLCISSQIGCILNCSFCATGKQGFSRNLNLSEIIGQLWLANKRLRELNLMPVTNVVMMGMGEPLLNFDNVMLALEIMQSDNAYGLSRRKVTLSTSGVVPKIYEFADRINSSLAISLHAPNDKLRNELVPINKKYPISELLKSCKYYLEKHPVAHITIEYVMLKGVNDSLEHAEQLASLLKSLNCKVNLIPFNSFFKSGYERSDDIVISQFQSKLKSRKIFTTVRKTRGDETNSACGQLVGDVEDRTKRKIRWLKNISDSEVSNF